LTRLVISRPGGFLFSKGDIMVFAKLYPSEEMLELIQHHPKAFLLLSLIAVRAKMFDGYSALGLEKGQALIGDNKSCGLTAKEYRTAKLLLEKLNFVAFQGTNRGTIATLLDSRIYDVSCNQKGELEGKQRASKGRLTRSIDSKDINKKENIKEKSLFLDLVYLTEEEHKKLIDKFGEPITNIWINKLNTYGHQKAKVFKEYTSHYHTILTWHDMHVEKYGHGLIDKNNGNGIKSDIPVFGDLESMMERDGINK